MLFIAATIFDVNEGVALTPLMVIYLLVFVTAAGVVVIALDPGDPDVMHRPPRDPNLPITNRTAVTLWMVYGAVLALAAFLPLVLGPDDPSTTHPSASLTMTFVVMGLGTVGNALTNRRDPASGLTPPLLRRGRGGSWSRSSSSSSRRSCPGCSRGCSHSRSRARSGCSASDSRCCSPWSIEGWKLIRRHRAPAPARLDVERAVAPVRSAETT